jgi:hypothetical protein
MNLKSRLLNLVLITGIASYTIGCSSWPYTKRETSQDLHETAIVEDAFFMPSRHGSSSGLGYDLTGEGGLSVHSGSVNLPEKYAVVFKCQHGKFIIEEEGKSAQEKNGKEISTRELWEKLSKGDTVDVTYREIYDVHYEDTNDDGKCEPVDSSFVDYDFIDANKK